MIKWCVPELIYVHEANDLQLEQTLSAYSKIQKIAKSFHENIPLRPLSDFEYEGRNATQTLMSR